MKRRLVAGVAILLLWVGGLGLLVQRQYFRPDVERFADAALRVSPAAVYFGVEQQGEPIGFASSTIDTSTTSLTQDEYLAEEAASGGIDSVQRRTSVRTHIDMSRTLRIRSFELQRTTGSTSTDVSGRVLGDTLLTLAITSGTGTPHTMTVKLGGPFLLPAMVPLVIGLGEKPSVGAHYVLPIFDTATLTPRDVEFSITAESLFVVNDSAVFDSTNRQWRGVQPDTVHAWQVSATGNVFSGWIDEDGRVVQTVRRGFQLARLPYEVAFYDWPGNALLPDTERALAARRAHPSRAARSASPGASLIPLPASRR